MGMKNSTNHMPGFFLTKDRSFSWIGKCASKIDWDERMRE